MAVNILLVANRDLLDEPVVLPSKLKAGRLVVWEITYISRWTLDPRAFEPNCVYGVRFCELSWTTCK